MIETRDLRVEANRLVSGGVARDLEHARAIIRDLDERRERSDAVLFYVNPSEKNLINFKLAFPSSAFSFK